MTEEAAPEHPGGATCVDCVHYKRCALLLGVVDLATMTRCDWSPSRFRLPTYDETKAGAD